MSNQTTNLPQDFIERVREAVQRLQSEGIILWRPYVDDDIAKIFDISIADHSIGCNNESCNHNSHDPASPFLKITPKEGKLLFLGELEYGEIKRVYYALLRQSGTLYYEVVEEPFYHTKIFPVQPSAVPDFLLARFSNGE